MSDDHFELSRWQNAIEEADAFRDGLKKPSNLAPLVKLLRSGSPMPRDMYELLADLLSRHSLKLKATRTPIYTQSQSEINALVLMKFVEEFKQQPKWPRGPITRTEIDEATKIMQQRAKVNGRGQRVFYGKPAAIKLREERLQAFADYNGLNYKEFRRAVEGKDGSINRNKARRP